jgi:hypothetical protein
MPSILKLALVGDHAWERYLIKLAGWFYAAEARYFEDIDEAWAWLHRPI